jgi:hypothetical protein
MDERDVKLSADEGFQLPSAARLVSSGSFHAEPYVARISLIRISRVPPLA